MAPGPWQRRASRAVVSDRWLRLTVDVCQLPSGEVIEPYYVLHDADWVHVAAVDDAGRWLVVRQYRYAADAVCVELPGGGVAAGETPLQAAQRELMEETGYTAARWTDAGWMYPNPARQTNKIHIFTATGLVRSASPAPEVGEDIECAFMTSSEIEAAIAAGVFSQALHIATYFRCERQLGQARP